MRYFLLLLSLTLGGLGAAEKPLVGQVVGQKDGQLSVQVETFNRDTPLVLKLSEGDNQLSWQGHRVRFQILKTEQGIQAQKLFPADEDGLRRMAEVTDALHRETLDKGRLVTRLPNDLMPNMALWDQDAKLVFKNDFLGAPLAVNFIFTSCRSAKMCPASTQSMKRLGDALEKNPALAKIKLLTITFDPETDSPGVLRAYAQGYGINQQRHRFLTGDSQQIGDLMKQYGIVTVRDDGTIVHNTALILISAEGRIFGRHEGAVFDAEEIVASFQAQLNRPAK